MKGSKVRRTVRHRVALVVSVLVASMLLLAACGESDDGSGDTSADGGVIKIGALWPMSGDLAKTGRESRDAMQLAVDEINEAGGIEAMDGARLELVVADYQGDAELAVSELQRLVDRESVAAVVGGAQSSVCIPVSQTSEQLGVPFVVASAMSDEITEQGYEYTFRVMPKSASYAEFEVQFVQALPELNDSISPVRRVATIHEDSDFGQNMADNQAKFLEQAGLAHSGDVAYPYDATDLTTQLDKVRASKPDFVLASTYLIDAIVLGQARSRLGMTQLFCDSSGGAQDPGFVENLGGAAETWCTITEFSRFASDQAGKFYSSFEAEFSRPVFGGGALAYQCVYAIEKALEEGGSAERAAIRDALDEVRLDTAAGDIIVLPQASLEFDDEGQAIEVGLVIGQWQDGKLMPVFPVEFSSASLQQGQ